MLCFALVLGISKPPDDCQEPSPTIGPPKKLPLEDPICFGPLVAIAFLFLLALIVIVMLVIVLRRSRKTEKANLPDSDGFNGIKNNSTK